MSSILKGIVNEVNPRDYDSDIDYYRALRRATQPKPERDVDDRPEYDIDMDRPVRKTRQPLIKIVDKEGISPETKNPYNTVMFLWGENNSDIELQIRKYEDIHWGAKNIVDIVDLPTKTDKVAKVVYIFDNHKYGYKQPTKKTVTEEEVQNKLALAVQKFYDPIIDNIKTEKVDSYVDKARILLDKTDDPNIRKKLIDIFVRGKKNPMLQGAIITTVAALLAGGVLNISQSAGLNPRQTNIVLQAVLNTIVPTLVSRLNNKNWKDTIKYTLASALVGTGIASVFEDDKTESAIMKGIQIEGANYNTAKNIALEIHQDVTDLGHIFAAGSKIGAGNPHNVEQLKQNIIDLNGELLNLGFEYDPRAKDFMKPMTVDVGARISENNGLPYPGTYEQETNMFKRKGAYRIGALTN